MGASPAGQVEGALMPIAKLGPSHPVEVGRGPSENERELGLYSPPVGGAAFKKPAR